MPVLPGTAGPASIVREIGALAAWSVTSAKPGNGVELLRDGSTDTYWQSDGAQPHLVNIQFPKRVDLSELHVYLDFKSDESYTPSRLAVRVGSTHHDLKDVCIVELREPTGWVVVPLAATQASKQLRAFHVQVAVLANHQNGRDTHMRQVLVYGPANSATPGLRDAGMFDSLEFKCYSTMR
eukprot:GHRQ01017843.1.p1 GENE.GHRQ01017843.1~~GHRQ01017843.1.p1  ORF type:complete len:181 (+),score=47.12 GHRQ01017843.1:565-1107(+)